MAEQNRIDLKSETAIFLLDNGDYEIITHFFSSEDVYVPEKYLAQLRINIIVEVIFQLAKEHSNEAQL